MSMQKQKQKQNQKKSSVEGEGSYTASRRYREGLEKSVAKGNSATLARKAQKAYDGPEGKELRRAEAAAKKKKATTTPKKRASR